jgi:hypothetical protein
VAFRREIAEQVGDWDEHLGVGSEFPSAGDTDYKLRIEALGFKMRSTPRAAVDHTYGWRVGLQDVLALQRSQARGLGALAAKLTLMGDPRGGAWLRTTWQDRLLRWLRWRQPQRLPTDLRILWHFHDGYAKCLRGYRVDARGLLARRQAALEKRTIDPGPDFRWLADGAVRRSLASPRPSSTGSMPPGRWPSPTMPSSGAICTWASRSPAWCASTACSMPRGRDLRTSWREFM